MSRYIDADKLKKHYAWWATSGNPDLEERKRDFDTIVDLQPTVEAVPRMHGVWVHEGENLWRCSKCGNTIYSETWQDKAMFHKWCGRCGAIMDK